MDKLRDRLRADVAEVAQSGATSLTKNGTTFIFERRPDGDICVVTVMTDKMRMGTHPRQQYKRDIARGRQRKHAG